MIRRWIKENGIGFYAPVGAIMAIIAALILAQIPLGNDVGAPSGRHWVVEAGETYQTSINDDGQIVNLSCTIAAKSNTGNVAMNCVELN